MATQQPFESALRLDAERAFSLPVGAASPLWFAFFGVAAGASTWWWMSKWARDLALDGAASAADDGLRLPTEAASFEPPEEAEAATVETTAAELVVDPVTEAPVIAAPQIAAPEALAPQTVVAQAAAVADDLTRLTGIGPKLAVALAERGVTTFAQIAAWTGKDLDDVDKALSLKGRAVRDAWVSQARRLAAS